MDVGGGEITINRGGDAVVGVLVWPGVEDLRMGEECKSRISRDGIAGGCVDWVAASGLGVRGW